MTMQAQAGNGSWSVTSQAEYTQIQPDGTPVRGYKVYYRTGNGQTGSVFVPPESYNPESVRAMIQAAAANTDAIGALSSGG